MRASDNRTEARPGLDPSDTPAAGIPRVGDVIDSKYRVERILGVGGMGVVVAVTHLQLGEPYAIKFLLPGSQRDPESVERFMREARAAVRIKSDHIVRVNDVGQLPDGSPFILMEYLVGRDVSDELHERGPLPIRDAAEYVLQACAGIAEAHALGIVHRDLKPSNLFLTQRSDGAVLVKVLDFGIAKAMDSTSPSPSLTQTSSAFGSPAYMSPEQVRSAKRVDFRTDVWSLGVILFELLTGVLPFEAESAAGLLAAIAADEPFRVRRFRPEVSEELDAIVRACLEKDLTQRIPSVAELANRLEPFASGSLVSLGRIRRLAPHADAPSNRYSIPVRPQSGATHLVDAATERALTNTNRQAKPKKSAAVPLAIAVALVGALGAGAITVQVRTRRPLDAESAAPPPVSVPLANAPASLAVPHEPAPLAPPSSATPPSSAAPAPSAIASESRTSALPKGSRPPVRPGVPGRPTTEAPTGGPLPAPSPPPPPNKVQNVDPTAESH